jgi:hypothetical protein
VRLLGTGSIGRRLAGGDARVGRCAVVYSNRPHRPLVILLNAHDRVDDHRWPAVGIALLVVGQARASLLAMGGVKCREPADRLMPSRRVTQQLLSVEIVEHHFRFAGRSRRRQRRERGRLGRCDLQ